MFKVALLLLVACAIVACSANSSGDENNLIRSRVKPDVIPLNTKLTTQLEISYEVNGTYIPILQGNLLRDIETRDPPIVRYKFSNNVMYTLALVDPDTEDTEQYFVWLVANIRGDNVDQGLCLLEYDGYTPTTSGTGSHRYIFVLFEQRQLLNIDPRDVPRLWSIRGFQEFNDVGPIVGANFFFASYVYPAPEVMVKTVLESQPPVVSRG